MNSDRQSPSNHGALAECFVEIVTAVTPVDCAPAWDTLWEVVPARAQTHHRWDELVFRLHRDTSLDVFSREYFVSAGTGGSGWDAESLAWALLSRPLLRMQLHPNPAAEDLARAARQVIDDIRALGLGQSVQVPARFMFDGPKISRRFSRRTAFGTVRWTRIPPPYEEAPPFEGLTVYTTVPLHLLKLPDDEYFYSPKRNQTVAAIDRFVSQFRLAILSKSHKDGQLGPPARVMLVQLDDLPVGRGNHHFGDPPGFGHGHAIRDIVAVCDQMERYRAAWDPRIETAARRLGQAAARSGQDIAGHLDEDALLDAMIALESMFGMSQELSFRLSVAVAYLLGKGPDDRERLHGQVKRLYKLRSDIVHGNAGKVPEAIEAEKDDAIRIGIEVLEKLLLERRDLLRKKDWATSVILGANGKVAE